MPSGILTDELNNINIDLLETQQKVQINENDNIDLTTKTSTSIETMPLMATDNTIIANGGGPKLDAFAAAVASNANVPRNSISVVATSQLRTNEQISTEISQQQNIAFESVSTNEAAAAATTTTTISFDPHKILGKRKLDVTDSSCNAGSIVCSGASTGSTSSIAASSSGSNNGRGAVGGNASDIKKARRVQNKASRCQSSNINSGKITRIK